MGTPDAPDDIIAWHARALAAKPQPGSALRKCAAT